MPTGGWLQCVENACRGLVVGTEEDMDSMGVRLMIKADTGSERPTFHTGHLSFDPLGKGKLGTDDKMALFVC